MQACLQECKAHSNLVSKGSKYLFDYNIMMTKRKNVCNRGERKMKYDFTSIIDRKGKDALAVDILPNMLGPGKK